MPTFEVQYNGGMLMRVNAETEEAARAHVKQIETEIAQRIGRPPHVNIAGVKQVKA